MKQILVTPVSNHYAGAGKCRGTYSISGNGEELGITVGGAKAALLSSSVGARRVTEIEKLFFYAMSNVALT